MTVTQWLIERGYGRPTPELLRQIEEKLDQLGGQVERPFQPRIGKNEDLIAVEAVIAEMGLEATPELVLAAEEKMATWFEHEFGDVVPIDDGGLSCYYKFNGSYYYREDIFRKKIEEIVRVVHDAA
jgi:uncharacterized ParB-like nuclease family protein